MEKILVYDVRCPQCNTTQIVFVTDMEDKTVVCSCGNEFDGKENRMSNKYKTLV